MQSRKRRRIHHDFVNILKSNCLLLNCISPKSGIFDFFLQLNNDII